MSDLERIPPDLRGRTPARTVRASPVRLSAEVGPVRHGGPAPRLSAEVRYRPQSAPVVRESALSRFGDWRRRHYVADQLLRVALLCAAAGVALAGVFAGVAMAIKWALGEISGALAGGTAGAAGVILLGIGILLLAGRRSGGSGHGHSGHGWHYTKCR